MCRVYRMLLKIAPLRRWRGALLRVHVERCPRCAARFDAGTGRLASFLNPEWIGRTPALWPRIKTGLESRDAASSEVRIGPACRRPIPRGWPMTAAVTAGLAMAAALVLFLRDFRRPGAGPAAAPPAEGVSLASRVQVLSSSIKGRPAKSFIYQTPSISFIWIGGSPETGGMK